MRCGSPFTFPIGGIYYFSTVNKCHGRILDARGVGLEVVLFVVGLGNERQWWLVLLVRRARVFRDKVELELRA